MRDVFGEKVRLKPVPIGPGGLLGRIRKLPSLAAGLDCAPGGGGSALPAALVEDALSAIEARALWSRYGL